MAATGKVAQVLGNVVDVEFTPFAGDPREESNLEQQVAELLAQCRGPAFARFFEHVERLISFFQKHRRQGGIRLIAIPRTTARRSQAVH